MLYQWIIQLQKSSHASRIPLLLLLLLDPTSRRSSHKQQQHLAFEMFSGDCSRPLPCSLGMKWTFFSRVHFLPCPLGPYITECFVWWWTWYWTDFVCVMSVGFYYLRLYKVFQTTCSISKRAVHSNWLRYSVEEFFKNSTFQASSSHLDAYSVQGCALHCLEVRPETRFAMVSILLSLPGCPHIWIYPSLSIPGCHRIRL